MLYCNQGDVSLYRQPPDDDAVFTAHENLKLNRHLGNGARRRVREGDQNSTNRIDQRVTAALVAVYELCPLLEEYGTGKGGSRMVLAQGVPIQCSLYVQK